MLVFDMSHWKPHQELLTFLTQIVIGILRSCLNMVPYCHYRIPHCVDAVCVPSDCFAIVHLKAVYQYIFLSLPLPPIDLTSVSLAFLDLLFREVYPYAFENIETAHWIHFARRSLEI